MRKRLLIIVLLGTLSLLMGSARLHAIAAESEDQRFEALANQYLDQLLKMDPELATQLGDHRYDDRLDDYSAEGMQRRAQFNAQWLVQLNSVDASRLSPVNNVDYRIWKDHLESNEFELTTLREWQWNPLSYNIGDSIYALLTGDFAPLPQRLASVRARLAAIPAVLAAARANLQHPPRLHTETAILQNQGNISLVRDDVTALAKQGGVDLGEAPRQAIAALEAYGQWLKTDLLPRSDGDFRLGAAKFDQKLRYTLESDMTRGAILQRAQADLAANHEAIYQLALPLFRQYFPKDGARSSDKRYVVRAVLNRLADEHPSAASIIDDAKRTLAAATDFVRDHDLLTLPTDPVRVVIMPEFERGVAVASCESPGPLEKHGETHFNIAPPPADWPEARKQSYFRENNNFMLMDLTVHEAMPGHYVQLWHAKKFAAPTKLRAVFESGPFVEGWAVYAERVMAAQGFGGPREHMEQLKMRLRVDINAILDQKIHCEGMNEKQAMDLMMNEGYQEEGEAAGKWRRACLTSTQLSTYYVGTTQVDDIVAAYEAKHGRGNLRQMHDLILSFGSPAPKYVRELMGL
jgi:uncharacterized protein (DUF885 family)